MTKITTVLVAGAFALATSAAIAQVSGNTKNGQSMDSNGAGNAPAAIGSSSVNENGNMKAAGSKPGAKMKASDSAQMKKKGSGTTGSAGSTSKPGAGVDKD